MKSWMMEADAPHGDGPAPGSPRPPVQLQVATPPGTSGAPDPALADVWTAQAPATREFLRGLRKAAEQDAPVYFHGEPGSGRKCAARTLCRWREEWRANGRPGQAGDELPVSILRVPSLRERPLDLPEIAACRLAALARSTGQPLRRLSSGALDALLTREWPGNIVELHAVLGSAVQRAGDRLSIDARDLPQGAEPARHPSQEAKNTAQRDCLLRQLRVARSVSAAAKLEGCTRANYIRLMRRLGILRADCVASQNSVV